MSFIWETKIKKPLHVVRNGFLIKLNNLKRSLEFSA